MSGPFGVHITIISGQNCSREIVVAASAFLSMGFLSIDPVAPDKTLRQEFLATFHTFCTQERIHYRDSPGYFSGKVIPPGKSIASGSLFWLALDREGEALAKGIFEATGTSPGETVYRSVCKLNLIEPVIPPLPVRQLFWQKLFTRRGPPAPLPGWQEYRKRHPRLTPEQAQYFAWFEALYEALIPWMDVIRNIQSDYS